MIGIIILILKKKTAVSYCDEVNNLLHKSILRKSNEDYEKIVNNYIKDINLVKINIGNLIISNYIIDYIKHNAKLIGETEFNNISTIARQLTSNIQLCTEKQFRNYNDNNVILFLFFDNRLMFNIF